MAANFNYLFSVPSLAQPLATVFPAPVVAQRAPTANDFNYPLGQIWIYAINNSAYVLTSVVANVANWINLVGGAGDFTSLTVNPGPTNLSTVGSGAVTIGNAANASAVTISVGPGNFAVDGNGHIVNIADDAASNTVTLGSLTGTSLTVIQGGTNGVEVNTSAAGVISLGLATMTGTITVGQSTVGQDINIGAAAAANTIVIGNNTVGGTIALNAPVVTLRGPVQILTGAGAPAGGLALETGDLYINTTAATAVTRIYVATAAGTWTNVTCAA